MQATYADIFRPYLKRFSLAYDVMLVVGGSILVALCAQLAFYIPFTPVPVTMQTFGVLLTGALLGSKRGALSMIIYLMEGAIGLPVFAAGKMGIVTIVGPTGGYLFGFIAAAFITGFLAERGWDRKYWTAVLMMVSGTSVIFIFGLSWLYFLVENTNLLKIGFYPFLPGAVIKIAFAVLLLPSGWKLIKR